MRVLVKVACLVVFLFILPIGLFQYSQWRDESNRVPRVRAITVLDVNRQPIEGAQIQMEGESFRPIFPILSFILQRGVWHPHWTSDFKTTGKDGTVRFSYKSDSAWIAELKIDNLIIISSGIYHRAGTHGPADADLIEEPRRNGDKEEKATVIIMKGKPNKSREPPAVGLSFPSVHNAPQKRA